MSTFQGAMAEDWRLTVELESEVDAPDLVRFLRDLELPSGERERLGERVIVSRDGARVFLYADTETRAKEAGLLVRAALEERRLAATVSLTRWHPAGQSWEDASLPLPETEEEWRAEHERLQAREANESRESGYAEWEVRVELPGHAETKELADRLEDEGLPLVRRHTYLLIGAVNEDQARALADRVAAEAPAGARVEVEPGGQMVWEVAPQNPFVIFGGLGA